MLTSARTDLFSTFKVYYIPLRPFYQQVVFITTVGGLPVVRDILLRENVDLVHGHSVSLEIEVLPSRIRTLNLQVGKLTLLEV